jgi:hypothetical protein
MVATSQRLVHTSSPKRCAIASILLVSAALAGDRHAFTAGVLSTSLPPEPFEPLGVEFVRGSISAPGLFEAFEYSVPKDYPLQPIFLHQPGSDAPGAKCHEPFRDAQRAR